MVADETAGDPMSEQKWIRSSLRRLGDELEKIGHEISPPTVGRLLKKLDFSLKVNYKKNEAGQDHLDRDQQFHYIAQQKIAFKAAGLPIISVDAKKKELIGDFKNAGQSWCQKPEIVNVHDFLSNAIGRGVPYGIYDLTYNCGYVYVGTSADTPGFAVTVIARWWQQEGQLIYPNADQILILADGGGSNGCRSRVWKQQLQEQLCDSLGLKVTVCHYPTGCSKYNPIEHRLFSQISINWAGKPLRTFETMLGYIRNTVTTTGLTVKAFLLDGIFEIGHRVSDLEMKMLNLLHHSLCPKWNYTISPSSVQKLVI